MVVVGAGTLEEPAPGLTVPELNAATWTPPVPSVALTPVTLQLLWLGWVF